MKWFHIRGAAKRRGDNLPARLRFSVRRGVTLVELMISMLILAIVCTAWLEIIGIQSAKKEARRREAVERLAGMMDAFLYLNREVSSDAIGYYRMMIGETTLEFSPANATEVLSMDGLSPIGYQLRVVSRDDLYEASSVMGWGDDQLWLEGLLYQQNGNVDDVGQPFFTVPVCFGMKLW